MRMLPISVEICESTHRYREWRIHPGQDSQPDTPTQVPKGISQWPDSYTRALAMPNKLYRPCLWASQKSVSRLIRTKMINTSYPIYEGSAGDRELCKGEPRTPHKSHDIGRDVSSTVPPSGYLDVSKHLADGQSENVRVVGVLWCDSKCG